MKTAEEWFAEFEKDVDRCGRAWVYENYRKIQADAIEAAAQCVPSHLCGHLTGVAAAIRALKSAPVEHKKCPGCNGDGHAQSLMQDHERIYWIECVRGCFRTGEYAIAENAWKPWDTRA